MKQQIQSLSIIFLLTLTLAACSGDDSTVDTTPPVITLIGESTMTIIQGGEYIEQGATAIDNIEGIVPVTISGEVNTSTVGNYAVTYAASDSLNNSSTKTRSISVVLQPDTTAPVITLIGESTMTIIQGGEYIEHGATATDNIDGTVPVTTSGEVDTSTLGNYTVTYTASDSSNNSTTETRSISVVLQPDTTPPVITLIGESTMTIIQGGEYIEQGATAIDNIEGIVPVTISGEVNTSTVGNYAVTYAASDSLNNSSTKTRSISVVLQPDTTAPVITLIGESTMTIIQGGEYIEHGATATDNIDGTVPVTTSGEVDTSTLGNYTVTYTASDSSNNSTTETRSISVVLQPDTTPPVITLIGESSMTILLGEQYVEEGATAIDDRDGEVDVITTGSVDTNIVGNHVITYTATDAANNTSTATRTVTVSTTQRPFITTWRTDNVGVTNDNQIMIDTTGFGYDYQVDWGDGNTDTGVTGDIIHDYASAGIYTISISGNFPQIFHSDIDSINQVYSSDNEKLLTIEQWGDNRWQSMNSAFNGCKFLKSNATDVPDLIDVASMSQMFSGAATFNSDINNWDVSSVIDMSKMFSGATTFNSDISNWDVSSVTDMAQMLAGASVFNSDMSTWNVSSVIDMSKMFSGAATFNSDISNWDVSSVTDMSELFYEASVFNQDISKWDVSSVTDMSQMFESADGFNQDISNWDVSSVTNMSNMFAGTDVFSIDISNWDVSSVTNMSSMFYNAITFNQDISNWDVSSVTDMNSMFWNASEFNSDISSWDVASVTDMSGMFASAVAFNQDIGSWDVSSVTKMVGMFKNMTAFNQDIGNWDVSSVTSMRLMLRNMTAFNQDISNWDVSSVTNMDRMFRYSNAFNQDISNWDVSSVTSMMTMLGDTAFSTTNYDALLLGWSSQNLQSDVVFGVGITQYSSASQNARDVLTLSFNWTIGDGGVTP